MLRRTTALSLIGFSLTSSGLAKEWLIPAYFHPFDHAAAWQRLIAGASRDRITIIINPSDGPGSAPDPLYQQVVTQFQQAGGKVLGYVPTCYFKAFGTVSGHWCQNLTADQIEVRVLDEIDRYFAWYGVDGIFLDEATGDPSVFPHYATLADSVRLNHPGAVVFANPGTDFQAEPLLQLFDVVVTVEEDQARADYLGYTPPLWTSNYTEDRFAHLVYNLPTPTEARKSLLAEKHNRYLYTTDDGPDGNPWDRLPSYWEQIVGIQPLAYSRRGALLTLKARFPLAGNFHQLYLDLDGQATTGYRISGLGAEILVENGYLHRYVGSGSDWSWRFQGPVTFLLGGDLATWTLPLLKLLEPQAVAAVDGVPESTAPSLQVTDQDLIAQANFGRTGTFYQLFLDLDADSATGFIFGGIGADYLAENGFLFRYVGQGNEWSWQPIAPIPFSGTEWVLPLKDLDYPAPIAIPALLGQDGNRFGNPFTIDEDRSRSDRPD